MSAVIETRPGLPAALRHLLDAWRSLSWKELAGFTLAGMLFGTLDLSALLEVDAGSQLLPVLLRHLLSPVAGCLLLLLAWLPADRSDLNHPHRSRRLALAVLIGSTLAMLLLVGLMMLLPWPSVLDLMYAKKGLPPDRSVHLLGLLGDTLWIFMPSAMMITVVELLRRRRRSELSMQRMLHEHSQLRRRAMAARLATLQAQVEPELLFDALVDIEQAYGSGDPQAPAQMDRLIRHLRVALPRLRDADTTNLQSEVELLETYVGVQQGLRRLPLHFEARWPEALRGASVPPMLLLPLLQRALSLAETPPTQCRLQAEALPRGGLRITLGFDRAGLCREDAELQSLIERLRVLSGGNARLHCRSGAHETVFTLELSA